MPFFITTQQPASVVAARNRLYDTADSLRKHNISTKIKKNNIILPNGSNYKDVVTFLSNTDAVAEVKNMYMKVLIDPYAAN